MKFEKVRIQRRICLKPSYFADISSGIQANLNNLLSKYKPDLEGIVLSYDNTRIIDTTADIIVDQPDVWFCIEADVVLLPLKTGSNHLYYAKVRAISKNHIELLLCNTFNVVIHARNTPTFLVKNKKIWQSKWNKYFAIEVGSTVQFCLTKLSLYYLYDLNSYILAQKNKLVLFVLWYDPCTNIWLVL